MFKNMKIGTKLFMGFGVLIVLLGIIGFVSWSKMAVVEKGASNLAEAYVPEVTMAANIQRDTLNARYAIKAYTLSREEESLTSGQAYLAKTRKDLEEALAHGEKHAALVLLRENVPGGLKALNEYEALLDEARGYITGVNGAIVDAGRAAGEYMEQCQDFLAVQKNQIEVEIDSGALPGVLKDRLHKISLVINIIDSGNHTRINTVLGLQDQDPERLKASLELLEKATAMLDELEAITVNPRRLEQIGMIRESGKTYADSVSIFHENLIGLQKTVSALGKTAEALVSIAGETINAGVSEVAKNADFTASEIGTTLDIIMIVISIAILLGMGVAFVITRMITCPLKTVVALSERAGSGDLTVTREDFGHDGNDELGQMANALAAMISAQRKSVKDIMKEARATVESAQSLAALSEETNASVEEVKSAVEQVSDMSEANSAALEETNAGVQEVSTSATTSAQAATEGASASARTIEVARGAVDEVNHVIRHIELVGGKSRDVEETINDLALSVKAISSFVDTITGIADQTNLLALNAAIEAARAGDAGRGFAVVADEVRKLAEESGRAASEVETLIATLQTGAKKALSVTNETGTIMGKTVVGAKEAQEQLSTALTEIAKISDVMQNIAAGAQEQAAAAEQMAAGVDQVSTATVQVVEAVANIRANSDETAKASEGVAEHAQSLTEGAERMREHLSRFRVEAADKPRNQA